jgi:hypothetical protein
MNNSKSETGRVATRNETKGNLKQSPKERTDIPLIKREIPDQHIDNRETELQAENRSGDLFHHPVIFDADVERFKNKLEGMLNSFKLESLSEILSVKKEMLEEKSKFLASHKKQQDLAIADLKSQVTLLVKRVSD